MRHRSRKPRLAMAIALVALGTWATLAQNAQASTEWQIEKKQLSTYTPKEATLLGSLTATIELEIPWYATTIKCSSLSISGGKVLTKGTSEATLSLSACALSGPPFVAETCKLISPLELKVKGLLIQHAESFYNLYEAATEGKPLATIKFKEETECPLPLSSELTGTFIGAFETTEQVKQPLSLSAPSLLLGGDSLKFGTRPANLSGKATLDLGGSHEGKKWGPTIAKPELGGEFRAGGQTFKSAGISKKNVLGVTAAGSLSVPGWGFEISCEEGLVSAFAVQGGTIQAQVKFIGCLLAEIPCGVKSLGQAPNTILATAEGELYLHAGKHYARFASKEFTEILFSGEECPWTEIGISLGGSVAVELATALEELAAQLTASPDEATQSLLEAQLSWGAEPVSLSGGEAELTREGGGNWGAE